MVKPLAVGQPGADSLGVFFAGFIQITRLEIDQA